MKAKANQIIFSIPKIDDEGMKFIESCSAKYNSDQFKIMPPHFTLMSTSRRLEENKLVDLLVSVSSEYESFKFSIFHALAMPPLNGHSSWYAFLVPDQGFSQLSKMHISVCSSSYDLSEERLFPFVPHITISAFKEKFDCLKTVNEINSKGLRLSGVINNVFAATVIDNNLNIIKACKLRDEKI